jgi:hypothetical protein
MMRWAGLLLAFLMAGGVAFAQNSSPDGTQPIQRNQTIQGCLSHATGSYQLTDKNGTTHMLMGDDQELSSHVGQEVKLTGTRGHDRDASASGNNGMAHGEHFFRVDSVTEVSGSCNK